jgi:hypothetical protein
LAHRLVEAGLMGHPQMQSVLAIWRAPERFQAANQWRHPMIDVIDVVTFGEVGLIPLRRDDRGLPASIPDGRVTTPLGAEGGPLVCETNRTVSGTLALRGPAIPEHAFPPGANRGIAPHLKAGPTGYVDTGYPCRNGQSPASFAITGPVPNMVSVGAYRFSRHDLEDLISKAAGQATLAVLPDRYGGHRLAGHAQDQAALQASLEQVGVNPLVTGAFRDRIKAA